jgi:hypothetical protein
MNAELRQGTSDSPRPLALHRHAPFAAVRRGLLWPMIGRTPSRRLSSIVETPDELTPSAQRPVAIPLKTGNGQPNVFPRPWRKGTPDRLTTLRGRAPWAAVVDDRRNTQPSPVIDRRNARRADAVSATSCRHALKDRELSAKRAFKAVAKARLRTSDNPLPPCVGGWRIR